ncbi:MAG TPA: hypothetical protein VHH73_05325, partial [Verrucomicrobiae bacterium]|nr:hypothetical protein [Verrucomicrobiae bacterium]
ERITARIRERLEITNDDDWKTIQPLIEKVQQAQREARVASLGGRRRANDNNGGSDPNGNNNRRNRFNGEEGLAPNADVLALREAVDSNAPVTDIKPKLAKVRALIKERQAALAKAQDNLRKALTPRQEAIAALMGLLR